MTGFYRRTEKWPVTASTAAAPGENGVGIDAYLRTTFAASGTYSVGVSNKSNSQYDPVTGNNDMSRGLNTTGSYQLNVQALPVDMDDSLTEAPLLGAVSATPIKVVGSILPDVDVDIVRFTAIAGQIVDFNIDTASNGPGGVNTFLRLFNTQGNQLASNNDATAPGEYAVSFDAYLRYTFASSGTYYLGISNANNSKYDPVTGNGDTAGGINSVGSYQLSIQAIGALPIDPDDSIREAVFLGNVSTTAISVSNDISLDVDVDMYHIVISAGQVVDFDIDTLINGPGGLRSYIRLFDARREENTPLVTIS